jgi:hypothetical protein
VGWRDDDSDDGAAAANDDYPDETQLDDDDDGDNFPLREDNFPGKFLPAGDLFLSLFSIPQRRRNISLMAPPILGFQEDDICKRALAEVDQGSHTTWPRGQPWPTPRVYVGPWWPTSASPSGYLHLLAK